MAEQETRRDALKAFAAFVAGSPLIAQRLSAEEDPERPHPRVPGLYELETTFEFEPVMHDKVPRQAYDYSMYGVEGEFTLRRNRQAYDWVQVASGKQTVTQVDTSTQLFGMKMAYPLILAPTAFQVQLHPDAEAASHRAAAAMSNLPMIVSGNASLPFERIAQAAASPLWYQLYPREDIDANRPILEAVQAAGARAIVVTVDQQASFYERAQHDQNLTARQVEAPPARVRSTEANPYRLPQGRLWYTWDFFAKIRPWVKVPMLIKGVLTAEDAKIAVDHGLDGIYVSNHGGRSMDYGPATLEALPEIVNAVQGRVPVLFDSGIRRGADALKALALGANAVGLGRVIRFGLGAYGQQGVERVLAIVQEELKLAMRQAGCANLHAANRSIVKASFP